MKEIIINQLTKSISTIKAIYIFGSQADNTATAQSDIDIAFLSDEKLDKVKIWEISNDIAFLLKRDVKETNTIFKVQILSTADRIYCVDRQTVEAYESLAYSFYVRFKEERKEIEKQILKDKKVLKSV